MIKVEKTKNIPYRMTEEDHRNLKVYCAKNGVSMQQLIESLVDKELEKLKSKV